MKISKSKVAEAYKKLKLKPIRGKMIRIEDNEITGCCALGALYLLEHNVDPKTYDADDVWSWAYDKFGMIYVKSFYKGFDKIPSGCFIGSHDFEEQYHNDGFLVREYIEQIFPEASNEYL